MDLTEDEIKELSEVFVAININSCVDMAKGDVGPHALEQKARTAPL